MFGISGALSRVPRWLNALPLSTTIAAIAVIAALVAAPAGHAQTVRNYVNVEGVRDNQLVGYGLVVGLPGSGDGPRSRHSSQSLANLLKQFGVSMPDNVRLRSRNVAAVMVSATYPSGFLRGQTIDVTVSSMGDARSLRGGTLLLTQLRAVDGQTYALAQGNLVVSAMQAEGRSGSRVQKNTPTAGRVPNGATIEQEIPVPVGEGGAMRLSLKRPDFQLAANIADAISNRFGERVAQAVNGSTVEVSAPEDADARVRFLAEVHSLPVPGVSRVPRAVINARSGTVVISQGVTVRPVAVSHGALRVTVTESPIISQPAPFSRGRTAEAQRSRIDVQEDGMDIQVWPDGVDLQTIVDSLRRSGATPDDVIAILQALDEAGALNGELHVI
ncbi:MULTISPECIES: flagellar basal body P-ring protein FlgI [Pandoraea]|uniref:Flagellar P-ring protein n=1 Tax=Pandoraea communis TaxID=2508297 RepID=A0A5E4YXY1_9BURK|nr:MULTISPECIES: flagellar basal body P-ring protein FlgI [Pandoraea]EON15109.1 flagellar basal body P-ring biosynthesis protein FlgA [Pandoraea sp. SD6-2]VVE53308.1 flagellar basal body P-ring protein FlgI [Pandoraea communis]